MSLKADILVSCMFADAEKLIKNSKITGDCVVINQCDENSYREFSTEKGTARVFSMKERGLTKSRNAAIERSEADICLLCDDDECFSDDYIQKMVRAYEENPQADVIIFKMINRKPSFEDKVMRLKFPKILKVSSWQISFKRESLIKTGVRFDEMLGSGTGNGAEEELKFLSDCIANGLEIWYVPYEIAEVHEGGESRWFSGFDRKFFENRGATTRYILGFPISAAYALFYCVKKRPMYRENLSFFEALGAIFKGIFENKIEKAQKSAESKVL